MQCGCEQKPGVGTFTKVCGAHAELILAERARCLAIVEGRRDYSMGHDLGKAIDIAIDVAADMIKKNK